MPCPPQCGLLRYPNKHILRGLMLDANDEVPLFWRSVSTNFFIFRIWNRTEITNGQCCNGRLLEAIQVNVDLFELVYKFGGQQADVRRHHSLKYEFCIGEN